MNNKMDVISQKEYLKKYLGIGKVPGEKKKKKKIKGISNRIKIIDDDAEINVSNTIIEEDLQANEDAPQIVAVIDERPPSLRVDDKTKNPLWQPIGSITSVNVAEQKQTIAGFKIASKSNDKQFVHAADRPPLKKRNVNSSEKIKSNDHSSPRTTEDNKSSGKNKYDEKNSPIYESKSNDISPVRKPIRDDLSPRNTKVGDNSPSRKQRDDDVSPPRKSKINHDISPPRKTKCDDMSPPRKRMQRDNSPSRRQNDDMSPPRRRRSNDQSPPNKRNKKKSPDNPLPRKHYRNQTEEPQYRRNKESGVEEKQPKKMDKTLDGKTAGLQYPHQLADETNELRLREDQLFKNLSKEQTGENAETVFRDRKSGKRRNLGEEEERDKKKREDEEKNKEKYSRWGRGLVQVENRDQKIQEELYEMSKPLARYADDEDLERFLKEQEREGDPMLQYIRNKKRKKAADAGVAVKPEFEGNYMPNRFGIKPGHRWDGVDRSNGYEKKWFEVQNAKTAQQEDVYKWSTEDM